MLLWCVLLLQVQVDRGQAAAVKLPAMDVSVLHRTHEGEQHKDLGHTYVCVKGDVCVGRGLCWECTAIACGL